MGNIVTSLIPHSPETPGLLAQPCFHGFLKDIRDGASFTSGRLMFHRAGPMAEKARVPGPARCNSSTDRIHSISRLLDLMGQRCNWTEGFPQMTWYQTMKGFITITLILTWKQTGGQCSSWRTGAMRHFRETLTAHAGTFCTS